VPSFMAVEASNPSVFAAGAGTALQGAIQALGAALGQFRQASNMSTSWTGAAAQAQQQRGLQLVTAVTQVIGAMTQANTLATAGGAQMQAAKMQTDATVLQAYSGGYHVFPTGQVFPNGAMLSGPHAGAFKAIARLLTARITASVATSTSADAKTAAALAAVAIEFLAGLLDSKTTQAAANALAPMTNVPPGVPGGLANPSLVGTGGLAGFDTSPPPGTALAGAGPLTGAPGLGGPGLTGGPALTGTPGLGGAGSLGLGAAGAGLALGGAGTAGAGGARVGGTSVAGTPVRGTGMVGAMPVGGVLGGAEPGEDGSTVTWLREDSDLFAPPDAPDGVLG
jgi:hypothetical protein